MTKIKEYWQVFISLGILACIALPIFFLFEHTYSPNNLWIRPFGFPMFTITCSIILSFILLYIFFSRNYLKTSRFSKIGFISICIILLMNIVNVLINKRNQIVDFELIDGTTTILKISRTTMDRYFSILLTTINFGFIFILVFVVTLNKHFKKIIKFFAHLFLIFIIAIIIFSLVTEREIYKNILKLGLSSGTAVPDSVFDNRNTFASFLLTGIIYSLYLYFEAGNKKNRYIYVWFSIIPAIFIYFTYSKTNIVLVIIMFFLIFMRHYVRNIQRRRWVLFGIETLFIISILLLFVPFRYIPSLKILPPSVFLYKILPHNFAFIGQDSIKQRIMLIQITYNTINATPETFLFGEGTYISRKIYHNSLILHNAIYSLTGFGNYHNGFAEVFHSFGLVGFIIYVFCILYLFVGIIRLFFYKKEIAFFLIMTFCVFFGRAMLESQALLLFKTDPIFASIPLVLLTVYYVNKYKCSLFHPFKKKAAKAA